MLRENFPQSNEGASLYGGYLVEKNEFCKVFELPGNFDVILKEINIFLKANGYKEAALEEFDELHVYDIHPVKITPHAYQNKFVLYIVRDGMAVTQSEFIINELKKFRDARDWEQFHNPKDLAIALSIEANELLEQFLWKKPEEANKHDLAEELADVFSFALLLADKLKLDIETIVLQKIKTNDRKYPVEKSKGTAKKYNEL